MRITIANQLKIGIAFLLLIGLSSLAITFYAMKSVTQDLNKVTDHAQPLSAAAHEMEINIVEMGLNTFKYLHSEDPALRQQIARDETEFTYFQQEFNRLAIGEGGQSLSRDVERIYQEFYRLGHVLTDTKDRQIVLNRQINQGFEQIDQLMDENLHSAMRADRLITTLQTGINITEVGNWLGDYLRTSSVKSLQWVEANIEETEADFLALRNFSLTATEREKIDQLEKIFYSTRTAIHELLILHQALTRDHAAYGALRDELDFILDQKVQALASQTLRSAELSATQTSQYTIMLLIILLPLFLMAGLGTAWWLLREIIPQLRNLMKGTQAVSQGDFRRPLVAKGQNEFSELINNFNSMIKQLDDTTVSKKLLEASQAKLEMVNEDLNKEIHDRKAVEEVLRESKEQLHQLVVLRNRLSQDLHDGTLQNLYSVGLVLSASQKRITEARDLEKASEFLRQAVLQLNAVIVEIRKFINGLETDAFEFPDLRAALESVVRTMTLSNSTICKVNIAPESVDHFSQDDKIQIINLVREALSNSLRHGQARSITIALVCDDGEVRLVIEDDGNGFDLSRPPHVGHGLHNMQERANRLGGDLSITSEPGLGTRIEFIKTLEASYAN
jgi:signal transduction histidine kinase